MKTMTTRMNKKRLLIVPFILGLALTVNAQQSSGGYFSGLGRAVVTNQSIVDTVSSNEGQTTGGYTLFDMGVNAVRNDILKAGAVLRVRNEFGGFFGDGVSFEFRQLRLEGIIGNGIKYELGDLDMALTPYTIHNFNTSFTDYESELFGIKRDIINYENFYTDDNTWRMQGANVYTTLKFEKGIETLGIRMFGNRIVTANQAAAIPDRFVYGGRLGIKQSDLFSIGINLANTQDIALTVPDASVEYKNSVVTGDFLVSHDMDDIWLGLGGELGLSSLSMTKATPDTTVEYQDGFYDINLRAKYKPMNIELKVGYRLVGQDFNSPTAQTRRVDDFALASMFTDFSDATVGLTRVGTLFDRMGQENGLYNSKGISTTLMSYNPVYGNATPFGQATPNRKGLTIDLSSVDTAGLYDVHLRAELLGEIVGENIPETRKFNVVEAGARLNINQLIGIENLIAIHGGVRSESTTRSNIEVNLKTAQLNMGVDVEVIKRLHVLFGLKTLKSSGNEFILQRDEFNLVSDDSTPTEIVEFSHKDKVTALGMKYEFNENAIFSAYANFVSFETTFDQVNNFEYDINQLYFVYTQKF